MVQGDLNSGRMSSNPAGDIQKRSPWPVPCGVIIVSNSLRNYNVTRYEPRQILSWFPS